MYSIVNIDGPNTMDGACHAAVGGAFLHSTADLLSNDALPGIIAPMTPPNPFVYVPFQLSVVDVLVAYSGFERFGAHCLLMLTRCFAGCLRWL